MIEVRAAYYLAKWGDGHILDNLIAMYTWIFNPRTPPVSHEEKWFPNKRGQFIVGDKPVGRCFSSTMRDGVNGCRYERAAKVFRHPERWLIIKYWISENQYKAMLEESDHMVEMNKGYNKWGLAVGFFTLKPRHGTVGRYYCSQACQWLDYFIRYFLKWVIRISPRRSWKRRIIDGGISMQLKTMQE